MNILILPQNMASMPSLTAEALNKIDGVNAKCLTISLSKYQSLGPDTIYLPISDSKRAAFKWLWNKITFKKSRLFKLLQWADVLHYHWDSAFSDGRDLKWAAKSGKPIFIEWVGSEIRIPEICKRINPYYRKAFEDGYEYKSFESEKTSFKNQSKFQKVNAVPLIIPEMNLYVQKQMFPLSYPSQLRINLKEYKTAFPNINNNKPLIIHSPSAKMAKGSNFIIPVIKELEKEYDFKFLLLHDLNREEVLSIMQEADIFIDQIILGSYGMAAMEAMAFGKPVMCYIMPEVFEGGLSEECPIVNTNPDNLKKQLIKLITNAQLRHDIGLKSRAFAEKFHDMVKISSQLLTIYKTELAKKHHA